MDLRMVFVTVVLLAGVCHAQAPVCTVGDDQATVAVGEQRLSISFENAELSFESPSASARLNVSLQLGDGWTAPSKCIAPAEVTMGEGLAQVRLVFPVPEAREFVIEAEVRADLPAVFVRSRLRVLDSARGQYYYWQTSAATEAYSRPGAAGVEAARLDSTKWDSLPWREWWCIPREQGGLAIIPTNLGGCAPGPGNIFLHALPRSSIVAPGDSLDAQFGLAGVRDAAAAAEVAASARSLGMPTDWRFDDTPTDYGKPAPDWLRKAEVYNLSYHPAAEWTEEAVSGKLKGFPFIIGSTPDKLALERCHRHGVKLLHYVVSTCLLDTEQQVREGGRVYSEWSESIDCETRDLKDHPDWKCIDKDGNVQKDAWGQDHGHPGLLNTCLHQKGLHEAAVRQVRMLMEAGYDGVFIDLAGPTVECYGRKFGKHTHEHADWTNTQAYQELLREVYAAVKSYGDDRVVIQNTCVSVMPSQWAYTDGQMLEAFPYGDGSPELRSPPSELRWQMGRHGEAVRQGKVVVMLPYFGKSDLATLRGQVQLSRAFGALSGFLWADGFTLEATPEAKELAREAYSWRLGEPLGDVTTEGSLLSREFRNGEASLDALAATGRVVVTTP